MVCRAFHGRTYSHVDFYPVKSIPMGSRACFYISEKIPPKKTQNSFVWDCKFYKEEIVTGEDGGMFVWKGNEARELSSKQTFKVEIYNNMYVGLTTDQLVFYGEKTLVFPLECLGPHTMVKGNGGIYIGLTNGTIIWTDTKDKIRSKESFTNMITGMAYQNGILLTACSEFLNVWDKNLKLLKSVRIGAMCNAISFSPCGHFIVIGDVEGRIIFLDSETYTEFYSIFGNFDCVNAIKVLKDGIMVSVYDERSWESTIEVFDIPFIKFVRSLRVLINSPLSDPRLIYNLFIALA